MVWDSRTIIIPAVVGVMEATMATISPPRVVVAVLRTRAMTSVVATWEA